MTLSPKNRGMPTLSLQAIVPNRCNASGAWSSVCVPLFLLVFLQFACPFTVQAQNLKNRTEEMHRLGLVVISSENLPEEVYRTQKNKVVVTIVFTEKGTQNEIVTSMGSGFVGPKAGLIFTARHLLTQGLTEAEEIKSKKIKNNPNFDYEYDFMGTMITEETWTNFPLFIVATGKIDTYQDIILLRTDSETIQKARDIKNFSITNPHRILLNISRFADAKLGEKVYVSGFSPLVGEYLDRTNKLTYIFMDLINYTFSAEITAQISDMSVNRKGVKMLYRLNNSAEPGFSGGMVLNTGGEVIGMSIAMSQSKNFVYAISSKDLREFLKTNKIE